MKRVKQKFALISLFLLGGLTINLVGCAAPSIDDGDLITNSINISLSSDTVDETTGESQDAPIPNDDNAVVTDFAVRLLKANQAASGGNTLVSPLSLISALALLSNGAKGETLEQMETMLGMTVDELNRYLYSYTTSLPQGDTYKLSLANSIWFTNDDRFTVNRDFLQTNANYYNADVYKTPFNQQTLQDINNWVNDKTDGMIPSILNELSPDAIMFLINALAFEADWANQYEETQVRNGSFTKEDGTKQNAEFMYGGEHAYLEDDNATGFIKYYKQYRYAFVALLPKEGVSVSEYVHSLNGESLHSLLEHPRTNVSVLTAIPKFETEYSIEMSDILKGMGMTNAFDTGKADLTGLGTMEGENIFANLVVHKTYIQVGEQGTRAGAVTSILLDAGSAPMEDKEVYLDRPFVYMLIDCENHVPFFMGTMMGIK